MANERTPLVPSAAAAASTSTTAHSRKPSDCPSIASIASISSTGQPTAYFLHGQPQHRRDYSDLQYKCHGREEIDAMPTGGAAGAFEPRKIQRPPSAAPPARPTNTTTKNATKAALSRGNAPSSAPDKRENCSNMFIHHFFIHRMAFQPTATMSGAIGTFLLPRKAPVKVEPKVHLANERTFLAWMHEAVMLAGASVAILTFAPNDNPHDLLYGVVLFPVSVAFLIYALFQYVRRSIMIQRREPGPYIDVAGPIALTVALVVTITTQFFVKLYHLMQ